MLCLCIFGFSVISICVDDFDVEIFAVLLNFTCYCKFVEQ